MGTPSKNPKNKGFWGLGSRGLGPRVLPGSKDHDRYIPSTDLPYSWGSLS